jgi:hypothetical protein
MERRHPDGKRRVSGVIVQNVESRKIKLELFAPRSSLPARSVAFRL